MTELWPEAAFRSPRVVEIRTKARLRGIWIAGEGLPDTRGQPTGELYLVGDGGTI